MKKAIVYILLLLASGSIFSGCAHRGGCYNDCYRGGCGSCYNSVNSCYY